MTARTAAGKAVAARAFWRLVCMAAVGTLRARLGLRPLPRGFDADAELADLERGASGGRA